LLIIIFITGCVSRPGPYLFRESVDEVESIEIVFAEDSLDFFVVKTLSRAEQDSFLEEFLMIGFYKYRFGDPDYPCGDAVRIVYRSGNYEMICYFWSEYVRNGRIQYSSWQYCDKTVFYDLLDKYLP